MRQALSIHIGLNHVDPTQYFDELGRPWDGALSGCVNDARALMQLASGAGFISQILLNESATANHVLAALHNAARVLRSGDALLVSYSGHGGQVADENSDEIEDDTDETWCLFDRQLVDDELYACWARFAHGVRILVLSDSCHSGSVIKDMSLGLILAQGAGVGMRPKLAPESVQKATNAARREELSAIQRDHPNGEAANILATVILMSGCQDNQLALDGGKHGLFTETLLKVWQGGKFAGSLTRFHRAIVRKMPPFQVPNYLVVGEPNKPFERARPFSILD